MPEATHPYSQDPYIRGLAIQRVPCFGAFSKEHDICTKCPLRTDCLRGVEVRKAEVAARLEREEQEARAAAAKAQEEKDRANAVTDELIRKCEAEVEAESKEKFDARGVRAVRMTSVREGTKCSHCGENLKKGSNGWWLSDNSGCYHDECIIVDDEYKE